MIYYKSWRYIDGKPKWVVVDKYGKTTNKNPGKKELKDLEIERRANRRQLYSDKELLERLIQFARKYGKAPTEDDFRNYPEYPNFSTYVRRFGSWFDSLKLAGLDIDLMGPQGNHYRGRQVEIEVTKHFEHYPIDLAGKNHNSHCDGICPNGDTYEVKSSKLEKERQRYHFVAKNKDKDDDEEAIQWYYFIALNDNGTIRYVWRVPGETVEKDNFYVGLNPNYEVDIDSMEKYDITDKFKDIFRKLF
jgi:hypothetical protein